MSLNLPITSESVSDDEKAEQLGQSCDFKIHCPWVSSTKRDGTPHWVQSVIGELEPEKQRELFENQSSPRHKQDEILFLNTSRSLETCEVTWLLSPVLTGSSEMCQLELILYSQEDAQITAMVHNIKANLSLPLSLKEMTVNKRSNWKMLSSETTGVNEPFRISLDYTHCDRAADHFIVLESLTLKHCSAAGYQDSDVPTCIEETSFFCDNGDCMSHVKLCDFNWDCPTGEDEGALCEIILPPGSYCSFEDGTCGWTSYEGSDARWLFTDSAQMEDTSPTDLKFVKGHFLYLSVQSKYSDGNATTYSAMIPVVAPENDCQLRFKFLISGIYNGSLGIYGLEEEKEFESSVKLWVKEGPLGDFWNSGTLQIPQFQNRFRLLVVAVWGWNTHAHIALDNVTFSADCFHAGRIEIGYENRGSMDDFEDTVTPLSEPFYTDENSELELQFTTCGASGPHGPTQTQCDNAYRNSNISVVVGKDGPLRGLQMWKVPFTSTYQISAYGAAGGKGAKNHNNPAHGVFISAIFPLHKDETLFILVGQQGEDACPGKNELTREICTGKSSVIEDNYDDQKKFSEWAGGGGGGGGASYVFKEVNGEFIPLLVAAGGGGKAYLEDTEDPLDLTQPERFENNTAVPGLNGMSAAAGGGGGWNEITDLPVAGKSLVFGAEGGQSCYKAIIKLQWHTAGGFGGGGGPCTSGGGGGGYQGGNASELDEIFSDGQYGVSFFHPSVKIFLHPLAAMEGHGEVQIKLFVNCSHCHTDNCKRDAISRNVVCLCDIGTVLASDNITCIVPKWAIAEKQLPLSLIFAVLIATVILGVIFACGSLSFVYHRKKKQLEGARVRLQSTEYKLSKIRSSIIMTDYNPNYCFAGKGAGLSELKEVPRKNITLLRALGHGAFGEVYEGMVVGISGDPNPLQVAIKTLPEICSEQDEMDFLMEALIISKFSHQNIVRCIGVSLQTLPRFILLELMSGGDMKSFLRHNRPWLNKPSTLSMLDLLNMARDIACGCKYLEDNHFIHRDIAARNCLLMYSGTGRVAKIGDFGMARDIYRASYYRKGGRAMLPVKWMPPEAFLEGVFTSKTDTWSFGVLLWEIFSLGYMPYPCKTNQEVLEFVTSGGRMDPPKNCPGPVYRIMTQCWQHTPGHRPNFSTILERISYCTQDPDVINTPLPIESGPAPEDEGSTSIRPNNCNGINPMMSSPPLAPLLDTQSIEQKLGDAPQELLVENLAGWNIKTPGLPTVAESTEGSWFQSNLNSTTEPNPQTTHKLKNKSKNLWNPTYGSWVMESTC